MANHAWCLPRSNNARARTGRVATGMQTRGFSWTSRSAMALRESRRTLIPRGAGPLSGAELRDVQSRKCGRACTPISAPGRSAAFLMADPVKSRRTSWSCRIAASPSNMLSRRRCANWRRSRLCLRPRRLSARRTPTDGRRHRAPGYAAGLSGGSAWKRRQMQRNLRVGEITSLDCTLALIQLGMATGSRGMRRPRPAGCKSAPAAPMRRRTHFGLWDRRHHIPADDGLQRRHDAP